MVFFANIVEYIAAWGYPAIVAGMALESANIPIPSELIFGFAGYLVYLGHLDFKLVVITGVLGGLLGSILSYLAGYYGGRPFVEKYGRYVFLSARKLALTERWFARYGLAAVFWARLLPVVRTFISLPAGFARVDFGKFVLYTVLGSVPWTIMLVYAGMLLGENWYKLLNLGHAATLVVVAALVLVVMYYFWRGKAEPRRE